MAAPAVVRGSILAYRTYDAGDLIDLDGAAKALPDARRFSLEGPLASGLMLAVHPLEVDLPSCELEVAGIDRPIPVTARVSARIFDFGVLSFVYEIPIEPGTSIEALTSICAALGESRSLDARGVRHRRELAERLGGCVAKPHGWEGFEAYTIAFLQELADGAPATSLRSEPVAKLLLGEPTEKPLSEGLREDVLKNAFSYLADDLVIVDSNAALVLEPSGSRIVPFVLELATGQLLEFRYYDGLLDHELARVYQSADRPPRIVRSPFGALSRQVLRRFLELTEFTERVDNAIKLVGDFYLARVYLAALRRFRVSEWRESVEAKLRLVGRAYELLKGDVEVTRAQALEMTVIVLILVEIVTSLARC